MQTNPFKFQAYDCDGTIWSLKDCTAELKEHYGSKYHAEYKVISLRAGMDPEDGNTMNLEICGQHRSILGKEFFRTIYKNHCYHVNHKGPYLDKATQMITYDEAVSFLKCTSLKGLKLPYGLPICNLCHKSLIGKLDPEVMNSKTTKEIEDSKTTKNIERTESSSESNSSKGATPNRKRLLDFSFREDGSETDGDNLSTHSGSSSVIPSKIRKSELKALDQTLIQTKPRRSKSQEGDPQNDDSGIVIETERD